MKAFISALAICALAGVASAGLTTTHVDLDPAGSSVDGSLGAGEYGAGAFVYTGAGSGFGGSLGGGRIYMDSDNTNLYIAVDVANFDNNVILLLDTRAGGFVDADMNDQADGGRRGISNLANATDDAYPAGFLADFGIVFGGFGTVAFELTAGTTDNHLNFLDFVGSASGLREYTIPLASLGITGGVASNIDFFAALVSDSGYASNESIPANPALQANGNPGFGDGQFGGTVGTPGYENFNRFVTVPTPGALALVGLGGLVAARRRRA